MIKILFLVLAFIAVLIAYFWWPTVAVILLTAFMIAIVVVGAIMHYGLVHLNEMEVGVVFYRENEFSEKAGNFAYFLDSGNHFINPLLKRMTATMTKGMIDAKDTTHMIRTKEGIPITITWEVSFRIEYQRILPGIEYKMARALPKFASKMVAGKAIRAIRHNIEQKGIAELHAEGALRHLEAELCQEIYEGCQAYGLVPIPPQDVKIGPIVMPEHVEKAIEAAYERKLTVDGIYAVREAMDSFDDRHLERLDRLERFRLFYDGKLDFYMMEDVSSGEKPKRGMGPGMAPPGGDNGRPLPPGPHPKKPNE